MSENRSVELLSTLLGKTTTEITESLSTEEGATALTERVSGLTAYDADTLSSVLNNARRDYKDKNYSETKGAVLEKYEKELKKANGVEHLKAGVDYNTTLELNAKILELKSIVADPNPVIDPAPAPVADDASKLELEQARIRLAEMESEYNQKEKDLVTLHNNTLFDNQLDLELNKFKTQLDVADELKDRQIDFLRYEFQKRYELQKKDGKTVVFDKQVNDIAKDSTLNYLPLSSVVDAFAPQIVSIKENVSLVGRGNDIQQTSGTSRINWSEYGNDFNTYYDNVLKGRGIPIGSNEANEAFAKFKSEVSQN